MIKRNKLGQFLKGGNLGNQYAKGNKPNKTSFKKGHTSWLKDTKGVAKANKTSFGKDEEHFKWKGDEAKSCAIHIWIAKQKGKAENHKCIDCEEQAKDWSNKDHSYKRILGDYVPRCRSCHRNYDIKYNKKHDVE